jgi:hypothetical protein
MGSSAKKKKEKKKDFRVLSPYGDSHRLKLTIQESKIESWKDKAEAG